MEHNQHGRRPHFPRGRRGPDRRGPERRSVAPPQEQTGRDQVSVEQIMRDIRARIAQRHGIELTTQQLQELAARRLEAVLDVRYAKPQLLDHLRKSAGRPSDDTPVAQPSASQKFDESALFDSSSGFVRFMRKLLKPVLRWLFDPKPLVDALNLQAKVNDEAAARSVERDQRQAEWNALHFEVLQRLVTEVARVSIDSQSQALRIESLSGKVDFNERRVRGLENTTHQVKPSPPPRTAEPPAPSARPGDATASEGSTDATADGNRRKRRRRRGRRGGAPSVEGASVGPLAAAAVSDDEIERDVVETAPPQEAAVEHEERAALPDAGQPSPPADFEAPSRGGDEPQ